MEIYLAQAVRELMVSQAMAIMISIPFVGICGVVLLHWWIDGEIHWSVAIGGFLFCLAMFAVALFWPDPTVLAPTLLSMIITVVFFPYAREKVAESEIRRISTRQLDQAHQAVVERPDNMTAWFAITSLLYEHGLKGPAIAVRERLLNGLSNDMDPIKNQSVRGMYAAEERMLKVWRRNLKGKKDPFAPLKCRSCGHINPCNEIACIKCKAPYLLEYARRARAKERITTRLIIGWATLVGFLVATMAVMVQNESLGWPMIFVGLVVCGGVLTWVFRAPRMA